MDLISQYSSAIRQEVLAWALVKDRLPGTDNFSYELWRNWLNAVDEADRLARAVINQAIRP